VPVNILWKCFIDLVLFFLYIYDQD
jgi:hypothetical protein